jgi:hypothetical protein
MGVDADVLLQDRALERLTAALSADESLVGVEVLTSGGEALGVIALDAVLDYIAQQPLASGHRGGSIGQLEGTVVSDAPLLRCDEHAPPYQRLVWAASTRPPSCKVCGKAMQRVQ